MNNTRKNVLIIGAGSMGIVTGDHLSLAGAAITFLIRPHRAPDLERPQFLYCLDDGQLKEYFGYDYITDPEDIAGVAYDYVVITLDSIALRNEAGRLWRRPRGMPYMTRTLKSSLEALA